MLDDSKNIIASLEDHGYNKVRQALVSVILEKTLFEFGSGTYYKVVDELKKRYHCYLTDCYEHPEYLNVILKDLYGNSYRQIVKSINEQLEEFSSQRPIAKFIELVGQ